MWQCFFPFPQWRRAQAKGLDFICWELPQAGDIFLEVPADIGKSLMAIALARRRADLCAATYIPTTAIIFKDQFMRDFAKLGLRQLQAKSHYPCPTCLGDKRVKRRMKVDPDWYNLHTRQNFTEACDRSIRRDSDFAVTYILDQAFDGFYNRVFQFFPQYVVDALRTQEVPV